jgi:hypothetical protein
VTWHLSTSFGWFCLAKTKQLFIRQMEGSGSIELAYSKLARISMEFLVALYSDVALPSSAPLGARGRQSLLARTMIVSITGPGKAEADFVVNGAGRMDIFEILGAISCKF